ncbi:mazG-related protein [Chlamydia trachomatis]|nr:mazG-related protein [Chlamydia trachomatis]
MEEKGILQLVEISRAMALQGVCPWTNLQSVEIRLNK